MDMNTLINVDKWSSTTVVSDVLQALGYKNGQVVSNLNPINQVAKTIKVMAQAFPVESLHGSSLYLHLATYSNVRGKVIVVKTGNPYWNKCAFLGEIQALTAERNGAVGIIIDGCVRDIDGLNELQIPIWARGVRPNVASKEDYGQIGSPIVIDETVIEQDDIILIDHDGIVIIPKNLLATVHEKACKKDFQYVCRAEAVKNFDFKSCKTLFDFEDIMTPAVAKFIKTQKR